MDLLSTLQTSLINSLLRTVRPSPCLDIIKDVRLNTVKHVVQQHLIESDDTVKQRNTHVIVIHQ